VCLGGGQCCILRIVTWGPFATSFVALLFAFVWRAKCTERRRGGVLVPTWRHIRSIPTEAPAGLVGALSMLGFAGQRAVTSEAAADGFCEGDSRCRNRTAPIVSSGAVCVPDGIHPRYLRGRNPRQHRDRPTRPRNCDRSDRSDSTRSTFLSTQHEASRTRPARMPCVGRKELL
jgi:hypothetical protein